MTLKNIIQDMREGVGSISMKRSFEARIHRSRSHQERSFGFGVLQQQQHHQHNHNHNHHHHHHQQQQQKNNVVCSSEGFQCVWANLPPELLRDVVKRIEESEREWPNRRSVVACAGVCRAWRHVTKELVRSPAVDGQLTFPSSLKQPGSKGSPVQCFIKRDRATSTYKLFLSLGPAILMPARRCCSRYFTSFIPSRRISYGSAFMPFPNFAKSFHLIRVMLVLDQWGLSYKSQCDLVVSFEDDVEWIIKNTLVYCCIQ